MEMAMAMQQLQKTFSTGIPLQCVESGHRGEDRRDDPQQQWGAGHGPGAANKREYGLCRIKKKRQKVTRTFRQSAGSTPFQSWKQKYVFRQRRMNFGVLSAKKQSALDVVCYRAPFGNHTGVARRETAGQGFISALGTVKTLSDTKVPHRCMGCVFKIYSATQTPDWERRNVED
jgi:hypothetical protein